MTAKIILIISLVFTTLSGFLIYITIAFNRRSNEHKKQLDQVQKQENTNLLKATIAAQEKERKRIGANIHDDIGPMLSFLKLELNKLQNSKDDYKNEDDYLDSIKKHLDETISIVRNISKELSPSVLFEIGLDEAIDHFVDRLSELPFDQVQYSRKCSLDDLDQSKQLVVFRVIQESCNNIIKHSYATIIGILIYRTADLINISIKDNGRGFDINNFEPGLGVNSMKARAKSIGSRLTINSTFNQGTSIDLIIPIQSQWQE